MLQNHVRNWCKVRELIGLTWEDLDVRTKAVSIDHQLIYKDLEMAINSIFPRQNGLQKSNYPYDIRCTRAFEEQKKLSMLQKEKMLNRQL